MQGAGIHIVLAFLEGIALIISPCILPILPILLSGSLTGRKARPYGIIIGFILTFSLVTLFSRAVVNWTHLSQDTLRNVSFGILLLLGIVMLSDRLTNWFGRVTGSWVSAGQSLQTINNTQGGFWGGVGFGALVGIIWTPCAGPILAAVIVQVVIQQTTFNSVLTVIAFAIGAGLPMFAIALMGRQIMSQFNFFREHTRLFRKIMGAIIILTVAYLVLYEGTSFSLAKKAAPVVVPGTMLVNGLEHPYAAPEIEKIDAWINSPPLKLSELKGKVVLIDFWTYSCINCLRTLPYIKQWYDKYHDKGLVIIGVHSPEFEFEHKFDNVKSAVEKLGILYPVALDNRFMTWLNFHNEYWPAHYLINKDGEVVYEHFGEGAYDTTENNIRYLLGIKEAGVKRADEMDMSNQTPETYLGYGRADAFASPQGLVKDTATAFVYPTKPLALNQWALQGLWIMNPDKIVSVNQQPASLRLHFNARKIYAVIGMPANRTPVNVKVMINGKPVPAANAGADVKNSMVNAVSSHLYEIADLKKPTDGTLEFTVSEPGVEFYTFTFG